ncbi:MAG: hypothetical protein JWR26_1782 [Pedosphaera sp.]|nr:hypothetical protein [Pedosphaera sp.]
MIVWLFMAGLLCTAQAQDIKCEVCGRIIDGEYASMMDYSAGVKKNVCKECTMLDDHCFVCGLPVKPDSKRLQDGRFLCSRDAKEVIESDDEAKQVCESVRDDINRTFSRFLTLPDTNIVLSIVDKFYLESIFKSPGYDQSCITIFGATQTHPFPNGKFIHAISIISHLKKSRLMAVCAHEYTHAWMGENVTRERKAALSPNTVEGFCELMAWKYMESRDETFEMQVIKTSLYTKGQISILLQAESQYGLNTVLEWIKSGEDGKLELDNLDRIRAVRSVQSKPSSANPSYLVSIPAAVPSHVPDVLMLKGISGVGQRRFALINDATFAPMERGKVRVGQTNVTIQCLEIRSRSVVIQLKGSNAQQELFLRKE